MLEIESHIYDENKWEKVSTNDMAKKAIELVDNAHEIAGNKQISVVFTSNSKVQELNSQYRGKDRPTNVLSFAFNDDGSDEEMLGEIFIAYDVIAYEAKEQGKTLYNHLMHILIHGALHLIGYDHVENADAEDMEALEIELLAKIDIENPYKS